MTHPSNVVNFASAWDDARRLVKAVNELGFSIDTFEPAPGGKALKVSVWSHKVDKKAITDPELKRWITVPAVLGTEDFFAALRVKLTFLAGDIGA